MALHIEPDANVYRGSSENEEAIVGRCSVKKMFLENSQNSEENTCARVSFLIKLQDLDSGTGVFLRIL